MEDPYYSDDDVQLYLGDMREILPALGVQADLVVADPPYAETSLAWDRWPDGWPTLAATVASSMWCFGSMRMFLDRSQEFDAWKLSQDVIWEKQDGSSFATDRFRRVHESALHWYRGKWSDQHRDAPRIGIAGPDKTVRRVPVTKGHHGERGVSTYTDNGTRLVRSVLQIRNLHGRSIHPTEKPIGILDPLIRYACPEGGLVVDPFAGSGSTLDAARQAGRRGIGIEAHEPYAEAAALRLSALVFT
ncbi:DNA-methyltransferase [Streptomyces sp. NPDC054871]